MFPLVNSYRAKTRRLRYEFWTSWNRGKEREREIIKRDGVDVGNKREADPDDRFDRSTASFGSNLTPTDAARGKRTVRKKGEGGKKEGKRKRDRG